ncbi:transcription factor of the MADS box [Thecaphora frezii]
MTAVSASPSNLHNPSIGVIGVARSNSPRAAPIYDVPYGSVQLAGPSASGIAGFDLGAGFAGEAEYEGVDEDEEDEGENEAGEEDEDSDDGYAKSKGGKGKVGGGGGKNGKPKKPKTEAKGEKDAKTGRRKIKIEFIEDDARRHITFSKRKAGIMKKAYELATLTGTQVLLLVVSQTGLVYTFTTPKLQALVTQAEGRNLIQACLNAPDPATGSGDGSEAGGSPGGHGEGHEHGSQDDQSRPGSSGGASIKAKARPPRPGEIMTGPNTNFKKRPRNNSTSKASITSQGADGDDGLGNKRGRGRPRKDTGGSITGSYESDAAQKRRRTGSKSTGSSAMESNTTSTSLSSSSNGHIGGHLNSVLESPSLAPKFNESLLSPSLRGEPLQQMLPTSYAQHNANYAYHPMAYFPPGSDPTSHPGLPFGAQHHQQHQQQHQQHANHVQLATSASDGLWNGSMSPQNPTQPLFNLGPAVTTDRNAGYGYNLSQPAPPPQQHHAFAAHHAYPHLMPSQEIPSQEQRW